MLHFINPFSPSAPTRPVACRESLTTYSTVQINMNRSGVGTYAGAARRRVHLATVLVRPPSGHRPGRRQARHARILQIGLHLTQPRSVWAPPRHGPAPRISTKKKPVGWILRRESRHMPIESKLALPNYAGDLS